MNATAGKINQLIVCQPEACSSPPAKKEAAATVPNTRKSLARNDEIDDGVPATSFQGLRHAHRVAARADFETMTPGYNMLNAAIAYNFGTGPFSNQIYLRGTNLLDSTALNHASFIKSQAPLRGRHFSFGLRTRF
jgi:hypothetical protein